MEHVSWCVLSSPKKHTNHSSRVEYYYLCNHNFSIRSLAFELYTHAKFSDIIPFSLGGEECKGSAGSSTGKMTKLGMNNRVIVREE